MSQHRTICNTLYEIKEKLPDEHKHLADEALLYARKMSLKLTQYKQNNAAGNADDKAPST